MSVFELLSCQLENLIAYFASVLEENHVGMCEPLENSDGTPLADVDIAAVQLARKLIPSFKQDLDLVKSQIGQGHSIQEGDPSLVLSSIKPSPTDELLEVFEGMESKASSKYSFHHQNGDEIIQIVPLHPDILELPDETGDVLYDVIDNNVICVLHKKSTGKHTLIEVKQDNDSYCLIHHVTN